MTTTQYISVRESAQLMAVSEKKVMELIESRKLQAYRIADKFLRLKKSEVLDLRNSGIITKENIEISYSTAEKVRDFFYFNDFYLFSILGIIFLIYIILFK